MAKSRDAAAGHGPGIPKTLGDEARGGPYLYNLYHRGTCFLVADFQELGSQMREMKATFLESARTNKQERQEEPKVDD